MSQVWLAGPAVSRDVPLVNLLKPRHAVTRIAQVSQLANRPALTDADILVMEHTHHVDEALRLLTTLRQALPGLAVVLVGQGMRQIQLAKAFRDGVKDYFPTPYDPRLLAERIEHLLAAPDQAESVSETDGDLTSDGQDNCGEQSPE